MNRNQIRILRDKHERSILKKENVVACWTDTKRIENHDTGELCIVFGVSKKVQVSRLSQKDLIPSAIAGCSTDVVVVGEIKAYEGRTERCRPAPGGVSIGHKDITAGTLGALVKRGDDVFILSNNHVLANENIAEVGDAILQPGVADNGSNPDDKIATLEDYIPINFGGGGLGGFGGLLDFILQLLCAFFGIFCDTAPAEPNRVDAAIARPVSPEMVTTEILEIGRPTGSAQATVGMAVKKSGRTTGLTFGEVLQTDVTVNVGYSTGTALFEHQIFLDGSMSAPGDSGSTILNEENEIVALLFAGSDSTTVVSPIEFVLEDLNVEIA